MQQALTQHHALSCGSNPVPHSVAKSCRALQPRSNCFAGRSKLVVISKQRRENAPSTSAQAASQRAEVLNSPSTQKQPAQQQPASPQPIRQPTAVQQATAPRSLQPLQQQPAKQPKAPSQHSTYGQDSDAIDGHVKVIGLGQRGISATSRLMGNKSMRSAEFWVLDTDAKVLSSCGAPNTMRIHVENDAQLSPTELERLAGQDAVAAAKGPGQRPGSPVPTCGVAFLVAGAGGIPGGSTLLLQVAAYLRRTGYFVVAALTRPFDFEGRRKLEEADALIEALQDVAQLVVVVPQGVLTRASAELTINEASAIADNTLEVSCRAILWALGAPEVLRASGGTMLWHGRDLRQYKRLLSPPLEVLLTCPGVGGLGRGLASLPITSLAEAGLASGLSTLAEDAVAAAVESPFLEHAMPRASAVLCVLSLPGRVLSHDFSMATDALNDPEKYAIRAAVQVAAMTVVDVAGRHCEEVVVCAHVRPDWPHTDPNLLCLEATLLVLEDPAAVEAAESGTADNRSYPYMTPPRPQPPPATTRASPSGPILHTTQFKTQQQQQQSMQRAASSSAAGQLAQKPPSAAPAASNRSTWSAMSAIAGGSAAAAVGQYKKQGGPSRAGLPANQLGSGSSSNRSTSPGRDAVVGASSPSSSSTSSRPLFNILGRAFSSNGAAAAAGSPAGGSPLPSEQQQPGNDEALTYVPRMADKHVDSMVAQSLDLPPSAARWRHQQRRQAQQPKRNHFPLPVIPWNNTTSNSNAATAATGGASAAAASVVESFVGASLELDEEQEPRRDLRSRVAGMLQQERREGWGVNQED